MKHLDLFSGIGGFALAVDWAFPKSEHIFCEKDPFCQQILKKHWPNSKIYDDIKTFKADNLGKIDLLTGGFPCQPFSVAGKQRAKEDDRFLWPEMLRIVKETKPTWIVGENVAGIIELALEQVCSDLEGEGYEVRPFVIPACAVNAPHRRDRVWIIAHARPRGQEECKEQTTRSEQQDKDAPDTKCKGHKGKVNQEGQSAGYSGGTQSPNWSANWLEVATEFCRVDDGFPVELDGLKFSKPRHRAERLKALGNAIVPQVAYEIINIIKQ